MLWKGRFTLFGSGISLPFAFDFFFSSLAAYASPHFVYLTRKIISRCTEGKGDPWSLTRLSKHHTRPCTWHTRAGLCLWVQLRGEEKIVKPRFSPWWTLISVTWERRHRWYLWRWGSTQRQGSRGCSSWSRFCIVSSEKVMFIEMQPWIVRNFHLNLATHSSRENAGPCWATI